MSLDITFLAHDGRHFLRLRRDSGEENLIMPFDQSLAFLRHCGAIMEPAERPGWWKCPVCECEQEHRSAATSSAHVELSKKYAKKKKNIFQ